MTQTLDDPLKAFRKGFDGELILPGEAAYDSLRTLWNAEVDKRPAVIARCAHTADVVAAVTFGRDQGLEVSVRCGSHNPAGTACTDGGLMIDLTLMRDVRVDPAIRRVRVAGGALLGDMDRATQAHGLATTAGTVSHTGVGGLALGGGFGWLGRRHGLTADNLASAEVVTADGRVLRASELSEPDLFSALRGGGGNFGVVTEFEFRLHEVGPEIDLGMFFFDLDQGADALRLWRELARETSRDVTVFAVAVNAPPEEFVPEQERLRPGYAIMAAGFGGDDEHARVCARLRSSLRPLWEHVARIPYVGLQSMLDEANRWGRYNYEKAISFDVLSDEAVAVLAREVPRKVSGLSYVVLATLDQAYQDVAAEASAVANMRGGYVAFILGVSDRPEGLATERDWVRSTWRALLPYSWGGGSYVNAMVELDQDRVRRTYGPQRYARLADVKRRYDPGNLFHLNANIQPG